MLKSNELWGRPGKVSGPLWLGPIPAQVITLLPPAPPAATSIRELSLHLSSLNQAGVAAGAGPQPSHQHQQGPEAGALPAGAPRAALMFPVIPLLQNTVHIIFLPRHSGSAEEGIGCRRIHTAICTHLLFTVVTICQ